MWTCTKCHQHIEEDEFGACWECGAGRDGTAVVAEEPDEIAVESIPQPVAGTVVAGEIARTVVAPGPLSARGSDLPLAQAL